VKTVQLVVVCRTGCRANSGCEHILQEQTLPTAELKGKLWTDDELAFIRDTQDEPLSDVAVVLGRTYYAVSRVRSLAKRGILKI
jgi:hypothetical protein